MESSRLRENEVDGLPARACSVCRGAEGAARAVRAVPGPRPGSRRRWFRGRRQEPNPSHPMERGASPRLPSSPSADSGNSAGAGHVAARECDLPTHGGACDCACWHCPAAKNTLPQTCLDVTRRNRCTTSMQRQRTQQSLKYYRHQMFAYSTRWGAAILVKAQLHRLVGAGGDFSYGDSNDSAIVRAGAACHLRSQAANASPEEDRSAEDGQPTEVRHVLLVSVDGLHQVDVANFVAAHPHSAFAKLANRGIQYTDAHTTTPSDSFPGLVALEARHLSESTLIIVSAKHGQSPIDRAKLAMESGGQGDATVTDRSASSTRPTRTWTRCSRRSSTRIAAVPTPFVVTSRPTTWALCGSRTRHPRISPA